MPDVPFNLSAWIEAHRAELKPPIGNRQLFANSEFIVMAVGGPNARKDFHVDPGEEFFHQLEGRLTLRVLRDERIVDLALGPGDVFLLAPGVPHSPQREAGSVGLVIERTRRPGERDALQWYCERCQNKLYEESFELTDIETQFPPVIARFFGSLAHRSCSRCGHVMAPPVAGGRAADA